MTLANAYLPSLLSKFNRISDLDTVRTLFVITWDEDDNAIPDTEPHANRIHTVLYGSMLPGGMYDNVRYDHYSVPATILANWGMEGLGRRDVDANRFRFEKFDPTSTMDYPSSYEEMPAHIRIVFGALCVICFMLVVRVVFLLCMLVKNRRTARAGRKRSTVGIIACKRTEGKDRSCDDIRSHRGEMVETREVLISENMC